MGNSIFIDPVMKAFYSGTGKRASSTASTGSAYLDMLKSLQKQQEAEEPRVINVTAMTMEEYKEHITETLNALPIHSSRGNSTSAVIISNAGWERMKEDPAYEEWVVGMVATHLASQDPWESVGSDSYSIYRFGDSVEKYSYDNWGKDYPGDIKSYLTSELLGIEKSTGSGNLLFRLARKKLQQQNQASIRQLASDISQIQSLNLMGMDKSTSNLLSKSLLGSGNGFQLASARNALQLLQVMNSW